MTRVMFFFVWLHLQATGVRLGMAFQSFASIGTGIIIGFVYSWKLTLFIIAFVPLFLIAGVLQMKGLKGFSGNTTEALEQAGKVGCLQIFKLFNVLCNRILILTDANLFTIKIQTFYAMCIWTDRKYENNIINTAFSLILSTTSSRKDESASR